MLIGSSSLIRLRTLLSRLFEQILTMPRENYQHFSDYVGLFVDELSNARYQVVSLENLWVQGYYLDYDLVNSR